MVIAKIITEDHLFTTGICVCVVTITNIELTYKY